MLTRRRWLATVMAAVWAAPAVYAVPPALMLAESYHPGLDLNDYWVSEKYDGVRAYWDGERLLSRGGEALISPTWFTQGWPREPMDGELWAGRGRFEVASGTARQQVPDDAAWRQLRFMVFDLPAHAGPFDERIVAYRALVERIGHPWVVAVPQEKLPSHSALKSHLRAMVNAGAEGLMLHRGSAPYRAVRSDDLIKLKPFDDAEAKVLQHLPGKGRHASRMGALLVETADGIRFRLGTGFTDAQRDNPPAVGTWITYRYRGLHASGVPRFASFLRERPDWAPVTSARP